MTSVAWEESDTGRGTDDTGWADVCTTLRNFTCALEGQLES